MAGGAVTTVTPVLNSLGTSLCLKKVPSSAQRHMLSNELVQNWTHKLRSVYYDTGRRRQVICVSSTWYGYFTKLPVGTGYYFLRKSFQLISTLMFKYHGHGHWVLTEKRHKWKWPKEFLCRMAGLNPWNKKRTLDINKRLRVELYSFWLK